MGFSVQRGETTTNGYQPPTEPPAVEAEVVEEEMFAAEDYDYEPEPEEVTQQPEEEAKRSPLRSLIPDTEEDFEFGFRILRDHEYQSLGIPKDRSLYATREDASKNLFKISAARLGEHLKELMAFKLPPNYLWDAKGMTPECVAELKIKISYTARKIFPTDDWRKYKRGDLRKVGVENPKYALRIKYWEEIAKRSQEYKSWVESYQPQDDSEPELHEGEFIFEESAEEREDRHSKMRSQIEISQQSIFQQVDNYLDNLANQIIKRVEDKGLQTRQQIDEKFPQVIINPEITYNEDEDDL